MLGATGGRQPFREARRVPHVSVARQLTSTPIPGSCTTWIGSRRWSVFYAVSRSRRSVADAKQ
jgi:hypothetical protein